MFHSCLIMYVCKAWIFIYLRSMIVIMTGIVCFGKACVCWNNTKMPNQSFFRVLQTPSKFCIGVLSILNPVYTLPSVWVSNIIICLFPIPWIANYCSKHSKEIHLHLWTHYGSQPFKCRWTLSAQTLIVRVGLGGF